MTALDLEAIRNRIHSAIATLQRVVHGGDEVERLRVENAKLREVAERVLKVFPIVEGESGIVEGKPSIKFCDYCYEPPTEHTETCLHALADLALRGGESKRSET